MAAFATMPLVLGVGGLGTLDALLSVHVLAIVALDIVDPEGSAAQRVLAVGMLLGMCFLIKGPVGVLLPLLLVLAGRTAAGRDVAPSGRVVAIALAGGLAVVTPWVVALIRRQGSARILEVLRHETLERYFVGTDHVQPWWYLAAVAAVGFFPWAGVAVVAIVRAVIDRRDPATRTARYLGAACIVGIAFFSFGRSKVATYLLPLAPLVATLAAWELGRELAAPERRVAGRSILALSLAVVGGLLLFGAPALEPRLAPAARLGGIGLLVSAVVGGVGMVRSRPRWTWGAAVGGTSWLLVVALVLALPVVAQRRTSAYLLDSVPSLRDAERPLVVLAMKVPSLSFYLDRVPEEVDVPQLAHRLDRPDAPLIVADQVDLPALDPGVRSRLVEVGRQGKYVVLEERSQGRLDAPPPPG
jgi:4-amino-4-deoxy-L-arabinose transferase